MYHTKGKFKGNWIHPKAYVADNVELGTGNYIEAGAVVGVAGHLRDMNPTNMDGVITIGNNNRIGANVAIHYGCYGETYIGNDNLIMGFVNIGHDVTIKNGVEICPHVTIAGHCIIEDGVKIKMNCTVNTNLLIGLNTFIYSGSVVTRSTNGGSYKGIPAKKIEFPHKYSE